MRVILVTGGGGFIGSHYVDMLLKIYPNYQVINLDKLTYAANTSFIQSFLPNSNYHFAKGDIIDRLFIQQLFQDFQITDVIHLAAESHVDRSIKNPMLFVETNIQGTSALLEAACDYWFQAPKRVKSYFKNHRFVYISTDEVYGSSLHSNAVGYDERALIAPTNPYSATKAAAECMVRAYGHTYGLTTLITRATNNYGPRQHPEKLMTMVLHQALSKQKICLHGDGKMTRTWLHVQDHVQAIDLVFHQGQRGHAYNIGTQEIYTNLEVAQMICHILDELMPIKDQSYNDFITFIPDRLSQDRHYLINHQKIAQTLGWKPSIAFGQAIRQLVKDYIELHNDHQALEKTK